MGETGKNFIVSVNTGTEASPTWTAIAAQQSAKLNRKQATVDVTTKDSDNKREFIPSISEWSVDCNGLLILTDTGYQQLEKQFEDQASVSIQITRSDNATYTGLAIMTKLDESYPFDKEAAVDVSFQGTSELVSTSV